MWPFGPSPAGPGSRRVRWSRRRGDGEGCARPDKPKRARCLWTVRGHVAPGAQQVLADTSEQQGLRFREEELALSTLHQAGGAWGAGSLTPSATPPPRAASQAFEAESGKPFRAGAPPSKARHRDFPGQRGLEAGGAAGELQGSPSALRAGGSPSTRLPHQGQSDPKMPQRCHPGGEAGGGEGPLSSPPASGHLLTAALS